ncbi:hypothetical protein ASPZODRAFT_64382 [Penicilliopsis zonata CBS 506.65]|uniref:Autophagy-related protein 27 n=1 Tax=Penicilliopsis zonata CBS 506.65 TaxID=1073090 RepID=A0A1L9SKK7_9EURO|nr:hypothetical protein ASPZODRAFT_64382 [Penicilliopsis zonata CBS 506.65]OJJ47633.1 hypothetical protein ASPZODRAFT_64382 [Penicilliopsis zonata CBS 506.65]
MNLLAGAVVQLLLFSPFSLVTAAATSPPKEPLLPCVAQSPTTGLYFDLNALTVTPPKYKDGEKVSKDAREDSWPARGYDYGANFTLNICAPVIEELKDVVGVPQARWKNVSAYYEREGEIYSIGEQASEPFFRGRKLVLNYTNGSPCPGENANAPARTKSTMISFSCDREALPSQAFASFVGTMDSCSYWFDVRSSAACGGIATNPSTEGLGPAGVFGVIALIAVVAYLIGGCAYQRTVMHQRGWRQCPNFSLWAGIVDFIKDMIVIFFSSLGQMLHLTRSRGDGNFINAIGGRRSANLSTGRAADIDAENRLIDQLDEEWED